jgi:putative membrane protein
MLAHVVTVYLHFIGLMALLATLLAEHVTLQPNLNRTLAQRLALLDLCYGIAAGAVFITGVLRFAYFGKGMPYYLGHSLFYVKVGLFLLVAFTSIYPTVKFLSWRRAFNQRLCFEIEINSINRLRHLILLESGLLIIIPLFAVLIAGGVEA